MLTTKPLDPNSPNLSQSNMWATLGELILQTDLFFFIGGSPAKTSTTDLFMTQLIFQSEEVLWVRQV